MDILTFIVEAERGVQQAENRWSGAVSASCRKTAERSGT